MWREDSVAETHMPILSVQGLITMFNTSIDHHKPLSSTFRTIINNMNLIYIIVGTFTGHSFYPTGYFQEAHYL